MADGASACARRREQVSGTRPGRRAGSMIAYDVSRPAPLRCGVSAGYGPAVLVSDLRHFLDLPDHTPAPALRLADQLRDIVRAATASEQGAGWVSALPCRRRPGNRRCQGRIRVQRTDGQAPISWKCTACGDQGTVSGWQDTPYGLKDGRGVSAGTAQDISVSDDVVASLRGTLLLDTDCECVVYGARTDRARTVLSATDEQLDELLGCLAAEANHETKRRRRQRLDAAYDELSTARSMARPTTPSPDAPDTRGGSPVADSAPTPARAGVPDLDMARIQRWCAARIPEPARHQVRLECQIGARDLTIVERRAPWRDDAGADWTSLPVARLRYAKTAKTWTLYWRDRNWMSTLPRATAGVTPWHESDTRVVLPRGLGTRGRSLPVGVT
jgi:hypothetical protein